MPLSTQGSIARGATCRHAVASFLVSAARTLPSSAVLPPAAAAEASAFFAPLPRLCRRPPFRASPVGPLSSVRNVRRRSSESRPTFSGGGQGVRGKRRREASAAAGERSHGTQRAKGPGQGKGPRGGLPFAGRTLKRSHRRRLPAACRARGASICSGGRPCAKSAAQTRGSFRLARRRVGRGSGERSVAWQAGEKLAAQRRPLCPERCHGSC